MKQVSIAAIVLLSVAGTVGCSTPERKSPAQSAPVPVVVAVAAIESLADPFEAGGVIRARAVATVVSRIMAEVRSVPVKPGDRVRAGQTLVVLDSRELSANRARAQAGQSAARQAVTLAEADRQAAEAALRLAQVTHQRISDLRAKNSATQHELDEAVAGLRGSEARLKVAEARIAEAGTAIESAAASAGAAGVTTSYATLVSPFDGIVTEKTVEPGNMTMPGQALMTVEDTRSFRLEARLDESRARQVHVGDASAVYVDSGIPAAGPGTTPSGQPMTGAIIEIERMLDAGSHDFLIKVDLPASDGLRTGMYGRAVFTGPPHRALAVPGSAVVRRGQLAFVYVVEGDGRAHLRLIDASASYAGRVEVRAGLLEGERIVTDPSAALFDGAPVQPGGPGASTGPESAGRDAYARAGAR